MRTDKKTCFTHCSLHQGNNVSLRVKAVHGDIELPGLGLSEEDKATLTSQVSSVSSPCMIVLIPLSLSPLFGRLRWSYIVRPPLDLTRTWAQPSAWTWVVWTQFWRQLSWLCSDVKVGAVASLLDLARGMNRLQAFVHVSTAYANCNRSRQEFSLLFFSNFPCCPCYELYSSEATQTRSSILPRLLQESMRFCL